MSGSPPPPSEEPQSEHVHKSTPSADTSAPAVAHLQSSPPAHDDAHESRQPNGQGRLRGTLEVVATVIAPTALLTALLFYFGWVRTASMGLTFGIDPTVLELSINDYVLRSVRPVFWPLALLLGAGFVGSLGHAVAISWIAQEQAVRRAKRVALTCVAVGCGALAVGALRVAGGVSTSYGALLAPLAFAAGLVLLSFGTFIWTQSKVLDGRSPRLGAVHLGISVSLVVLAVFWGMGAYAQIVGQQQANRLASNLTLLPSVVVYSEQRLELTGVGIAESLLGSDSAYRFRYAGLRFLIRSGDRYFLLPGGWTPGEGFAIVLAESPTIRLEFDAEG